MSNLTANQMQLPPEQQAIRDRCFHPSGTFVEFPVEDVETSIPDRFEKIVRMYPDRIAIKTENQVVTYAELNAMANRVARMLLTEGNTAAEPIGLLVRKAPWLMAGMLGVLKAGKFFVLLDPSFPKARIATILEGSQASFILADQQCVALAHEAGEGRRVIDVESPDLPIAIDNLRLQICPNAFAYVIYTSGSTGQPKGVVQNHRNLLHRVRLNTNMYHICSADRLSLLPTGTSNAVTHGFTALLTGASIFPYDARKQGSAALTSWLVDERISFCWISSPLFRALAATLTGTERFPHLRFIQLTSEAAFRTDIDLYKKYFSRDCLLSCGLSSSETGLLRIFLIDQNTEIFGNEAPVGYAVEGKEILLLDDEGKEVGFNQVGEIVVRSRYLSPGYWHRPDLTAGKFHPDPHDPDHSLYYTADLGLMLPDGCLIHKGRKDFRVKIRGYGVDIEEVQRAMLEHPAIKEAVVVTRRNEQSEVRLDAYFTSHVFRHRSVADLRGFLQKKLPDYMMPSVFVKLDAVPLTPNGKVDRGALPNPNNTRPELDTPYVEPRTSIQKKLADVWKEVLGVDQIGIHDDFFDLGGHSLRAMMAVSRIHANLHVALPLRHFLENPTIAGLSNCPELASDVCERASDFVIKSASREIPSLLSFAQQRLWFLDQLAPEDSAFNMILVYRLAGQLNVSALEQSFNEIIKRHESWRTIFKAVDGEPRQIVLPSLTIKLSLVNLREIASATELELEYQRLVTSEVRRPFDLVNGPLVRVTLLRIKDDEHLLLLTNHHIVYDGWSRKIIACELSHHYQAFVRGCATFLPELASQYVDYAQWQRQRLTEELVQEQLSYWKRQLENASILQLPTDRFRPPRHTSCGARQHFVLSETLSASIKELSDQCDVTLFMTLIAAYQILLHRYSGQNDISVGTPIVGRNHPDLEALIGMFLNMLVLRIDLSGNPTFRELLGRVRDVCVSAYAHQELPFEKLVEDLHPIRSLSHNPLFQVTFVFRNMTRTPLELVGLVVEEPEIDPGTSRFDLELLMEEEERRLRGFLNYNTDLFDKVTIDGMLSHFENLLQSIVADPDQRLSGLQMLSETENHQLLVEWNDTKRDYPRDKCIHQLFEAQVERTPDAIAVVFEGRQLTYRKLNERANQLAHYLQKWNVGPEVLVGICVKRSVEMVVGILGILKAGGAYLPLDPSYPTERFGCMIEDAQVRMVVTQENLIAETIPCDVVCLDRDWQEIARESARNPESKVSAENLAYVLYTSGSTGKPKGVMIQHRSVVKLFAALNERVYADKNAPLRVSLNASITFDSSVKQLVQLLNGHTLHIVPDEYRVDGQALLSFMSRHKLDVLDCTPTQARLLVDAGLIESVEHIAGLTLVGGEAIDKSLWMELCRAQRTRALNLYGPTECTVDSAVCEIQSGLHTALIGSPIANVQIYILDGNLNLVPIGVPGELHIAGDGLARGYLNRPQLTREKFIANPFSADPTSRLYKTGDLARYLPDGNIEFLGRMDDQVKIRGYRVELGEIEAVLGQHPAIREAVVLAREDSPGDQRLVAYIVAVPGSAPSINELRSFLQQKLPKYMVPSVLMFLEGLPLTPNGKLNRQALPIPEQTRPELDEAFFVPRTPVEELLVNIWAEVLKVDKVGIHDNFFELGGHSLLATQLISRVRAAFQTEVSLRTLFERPTVAGFAETIEIIQWLQKGQELGAQSDRRDQETGEV